MWNLTKYPLEDNYSSVLTQPLSTSWTTVYVKDTPTFTFPTWVTTYLVLNPWKTNQETIEVNSYNSTNNTFSVVNRNKSKGASVTSTAQSHSVWSTVIISDNFKFWEDIVTAINSKINNDWSNVWNTFDLQVGGSNFRIRKDWNDMKFMDDNSNEISLSSLSQLSWTDTRVTISVNDTTSSQLENKLLWWDGISLTKGNAGGNETLTTAIDLDTNSGLEFNNGKLKSRSASTSQEWIVRMATDTEAQAWTNQTLYVNPQQLKNSFSNNSVSKIIQFYIEAKVSSNTPYTKTITHNLGVPFKTMMLYTSSGSLRWIYAWWEQYGYLPSNSDPQDFEQGSIAFKSSFTSDKIVMSNITSTSFTLKNYSSSDQYYMALISN